MRSEPSGARRRLVGGALAALLLPGMRSAAAEAGVDTGPAPYAPPRPLAPILARPDRIVDIAVCTRPFRAQGPRIEAEQIGRQTVIHNYGHGGSGWSLSWGSARVAVAMALASHERRIGVIGCGAIGLTAARVAQRAGLRVRIYCRERPPEVRSSAATGVWSPASRICTAEHATPAFERHWEALTRDSFRTFQSLLGLAGEPVEWRDLYLLSDGPMAPPSDSHLGAGEEPAYPDLEALVRDLRPRSQELLPGQHPFPVAQARRSSQLMFNLPAYSRMLMDDFFREGGEIEQRHFTSPRQFAGLKERTLIHATGWGARELLGDGSIVPVRGQTARLIPQPEVDYGINWRGHNLAVVPRRDGVLVQGQAPGDFGSADTTPDRAASEAVVAQLATLFKA